ncbi:MAG: hypothetical protein WDN75_07175 [Bacteroidota bacterium]
MIAKKIRCLIVDDEPPAIEVLKQYILSTPSLEDYRRNATMRWPHTNFCRGKKWT